MQGFSEEQTQRIMSMVHPGGRAEPTATLTTRQAMDALNAMFTARPGGSGPAGVQVQPPPCWVYVICASFSFKCALPATSWCAQRMPLMQKM